MSSNYTVVILFKFFQDSGYHRILQFKANSDNGLYEDAVGALNLYPFVSGPAFAIPSDTYVQVAFTRFGGPGSESILAGYVNGEEQFNDFVSGDPASVSGTPWQFFHDNESDEEESSGTVARIRFWNRVLSGEEIANLHRLS